LRSIFFETPSIEKMMVGASSGRATRGIQAPGPPAASAVAFFTGKSAVGGGKFEPVPATVISP
jgi:hypothetical protein